MPFWGPWPVEVFSVARYSFVAMTILFVFVLLRKYFKEGRIFPWQSLLLIVTVTGLALSRDTARAMYNIFVPRSVLPTT